MKTNRQILRSMIADADTGQAAAIMEALVTFGLVAECGRCLKPLTPPAPTPPTAIERLVRAFPDADEAPIELD